MYPIIRKRAVFLYYHMEIVSCHIWIERVSSKDFTGAIIFILLHTKPKIYTFFLLNPPYLAYIYPEMTFSD